MNLPFRKVKGEALLPVYGSKGAACFDLFACLDDPLRPIVLYPKESIVIPIGLAVELPKGFAMLIFSRSGHGFQYDVSLSNSVGVIDSDFRGEIAVKLINHGQNEIVVKHHMRVAQAMLMRRPAVTPILVDELTETERGEGGFGSTGD
jgi:dUTP pyrophosphatase